MKWLEKWSSYPASMDDNITVLNEGPAEEEGAAEEGGRPSDAEIAVPPFALVEMFIIDIYCCKLQLNNESFKKIFEWLMTCFGL